VVAGDQGTLFGDRDAEPEVPSAGAGSDPDHDDGRQAALERSVDRVRARFGPGAVGHGAARSLPEEGSGRPAR
jgi:hypothetical protein